MRFAVVGSGAIGGFYGARLAQAGHDVTFIARGAHLAAIRERGLTIKSQLGDFTVRARAVEKAADVPRVDVVIFCVKAYSNPDALPLLKAVAGDEAVALTLQNGVDSVEEVAATLGPGRTLGGSAYIATALVEPGVIEHTGLIRRIVFGELSGETGGMSDRVRAIHDAFVSADIQSEPVPDARVPIWEKFCFLAPTAGFTAAARTSIGPLWSDHATRQLWIDAIRETMAVAHADGISLPDDYLPRIEAYLGSLPAGMRSSLLVDISQGKPLELEALLGSVVHRGTRSRVPTPIMATLYAVLKPHATGRV